ncbi:heterogeneous nuclear ribonucleoprotein F-like [Babylonia areolata]|uniref:heterogeneous nuclear ribonucleoprotein F-like n=1 Tax=Babylonia areolata TaxID=304850 RepID=UPI003FD09B8F
MGEEGFVVRCRGLPWTATPEDVVKFFEGCRINRGQDGVHLTLSRDGRPSGEAFVEFASEDDVQMALKKNKDHLGSRYIEVFRSKKGEMDWVVKRSGIETNNLADAVVKLRGVPFGCSKEEIAQFFTGLEIVPNGIMLPEDRLGRSTGEAFVQFASQDIAERALGKHKDRIGHRYIEIFKSSMGECQAVFGTQGGMRPPMGMGMGMGRPGPYDRNERFGNMPMGMGMGNMGAPMGPGPFAGRGRGGRNLKGFYEEEFDDYSMGFSNMSFMASRGRGGMRPPRGRMQGGMMMDDRPRGPPGSQYVSKTGHSVHMRGMPFLAIEQDVFDFFAPLQPVRVDFEYGPDGRRTGEANVDFATHQEAMEAMKKHRANMQHRYIELFLNSTPNTRGGLDGCGGGYAGDMGGGFPASNMGGGGGGNFSGSSGGGYGNNTGSGFGMGGGGGGGSYNSSSFSSGPGQQFSSNMGGGGYGMGGGNMGGGSMGGSNMGGGSSYGGSQGGMNSFMDGGGYSNMASSMGNMQNPNYTAF